MCGFIAFNRAADEAEVVMLAVAPDACRRGIATRLLTRACAEAQANGARRTFLEVAADNDAARGLYAAAGFTAVSSRAGYYARDHGAVDAILLARDLRTDDR